jgi:uncharacterized protein (TIGR02271 family)
LPGAERETAEARSGSSDRAMLFEGAYADLSHTSVNQPETKEDRGMTIDGDANETRRGVELEEAARKEQTLRLAEEAAYITKETQETGRVRVNVVTRKHEEDLEIGLDRDEVRVERVPVNKPIDAMPAVREENGVTIMPVVEEVVTIHRQLMLVEEVHIHRVHTTEVHHERVELRRQEAVVTRVPAETSVQPPRGE